ncbi:MAG: hypothetical protein WBA50_10735 [Mycobacterium sp.]
MSIVSPRPPDRAYEITLGLLNLARLADQSPPPPFAINADGSECVTTLTAAAFLVRRIAGYALGRWIDPDTRRTAGPMVDYPEAADHCLEQARDAIAYAQGGFDIPATGRGSAQVADQIVHLAQLTSKSWGPRPSAPPGLARHAAEKWVELHPATDDTFRVVEVAAQLIRFIADLTGDGDLVLDELGAEIFEWQLDDKEGD